MTPQVVVALSWLAASGAAPAMDGPASTVGDGRTAVALYLRAAPRDARVEASAGELSPLIVEPDGSARFELVPPHVAAPFDVQLVVKGAGAEGAVYARFKLRADPPAGEGTRSEGLLEIRAPRFYATGVPGDVEIARRDGSYALVVSAGEAGAFEARGERLAAALTPPREGYPQAVIAAVVDERGEVIDWSALPIHGLADVEVLTERDASVRFRVGAEEFGPVRTDALGSARMTIRAPPGVGEAIAVVRDRLGNVRETPVELGAPALAPVLAVCSRSGDRVAVLALDAAGAPVRGAQISLQAAGVTLGPAREVSPGHYEAPVLSLAPGARELRAAVVGRGGSSACQLPAAQALAPHRLSAAPALGYLATPGRLAAPLGLLDVAWAPPAPDWLSAGIRVGFTFVAGHFAAGAEPFFARRFLVPLFVRASARPWKLAVSPYAGLGAGAALLWGTTASPLTGAADFAWILPSAEIHLGAEWKMGPGRLALEISYARGWAAGFAASEQLDGLILSGGYRLER